MVHQAETTDSEDHAYTIDGKQLAQASRPAPTARARPPALASRRPAQVSVPLGAQTGQRRWCCVQISLVGAITNVEVKSTMTVYTIDDGTAMMEVTFWSHGEESELMVKKKEQWQ